MWQDYIAQNLGVSARMTARLNGLQYEIPSWMELAHPEVKKVDERTPEQIKQDILSRLTKGA